jgi:hypothetical protein
MTSPPEPGQLATCRGVGPIEVRGRLSKDAPMRPLFLGMAAAGLSLALAAPMIPAVAQAQAQAQAQSLAGDWDVYCCNRGYHFTLKVTQQDGGTFSGVMIYLVDGMRDTVSGRIDGDRIEFDRRGAWGQQHWSGRLVSDGGQQKIVDGRWTGFGTDLTPSLDFSATRGTAAPAAAAPAPAAPIGAPIPEGQSLTGSWNLHCCNNSYLWRMDIVSDDGVSFKGSLFNLNTKEPDGYIAGRRSPGGRVDFTRTGPWGAQHWSAELGGSGIRQQMTNGRWAGTGSDMGANADFHAERPGAPGPTAAPAPAPPLPSASAPSPYVPSVPNAAGPVSPPPASVSPPAARSQPGRSSTEGRRAIAGPAVTLYEVWNSSGCGFTDSSGLSLARPARLDQVQLWYSWAAGETTLAYTLLRDGLPISRGELSRGDCDPNQASWCVAQAAIGADLEAGDYQVKVAIGHICQNGASQGRGFIKAYGRPR